MKMQSIGDVLDGLMLKVETKVARRAGARNASPRGFENGQKGPGVCIPASKQGGDPTRSKARVPPTLMLVSRNRRTAPATRHRPASAVRLFLITVDGVRVSNRLPAGTARR